tara:strand:+ start:701 stop:907 length:207 start_codon:yes stop_codon:yes gene_type:complete
MIVDNICAFSPLVNGCRSFFHCYSYNLQNTLYTFLYKCQPYGAGKVGYAEITGLTMKVIGQCPLIFSL